MHIYIYLNNENNINMYIEIIHIIYRYPLVAHLGNYFFGCFLAYIKPSQGDDSAHKPISSVRKRGGEVLLLWKTQIRFPAPGGVKQPTSCGGFPKGPILRQYPGPRNVNYHGSPICTMNDRKINN